MDGDQSQRWPLAAVICVGLKVNVTMVIRVKVKLKTKVTTVAKVKVKRRKSWTSKSRWLKMRSVCQDHNSHLNLGGNCGTVKVKVRITVFTTVKV